MKIERKRVNALAFTLFFTYTGTVVTIYSSSVYEGEYTIMIEVAICEDSRMDRELLYKIISLLMSDRGLEFRIDTY